MLARQMADQRVEPLIEVAAGGRCLPDPGLLVGYVRPVALIYDRAIGASDARVVAAERVTSNRGWGTVWGCCN
jgi:hypothetical protein